MTGLNLETFLHVLRADVAAWATLGVVAGVLGLLAWTSWGSRRALRKCLVLSVLAHVLLACYGGTLPLALLADATGSAEPDRERVRRIEVSSEPDGAEAPGGPAAGGGAVGPWDRGLGGPALADAKLAAPRRSEDRPEIRLPRARAEDLEAVRGAPEAPSPDAPAPEAREVELAQAEAEVGQPPAEVQPAEAGEVAAVVPFATADAGTATAEEPAARPADRRLRPAVNRPERPAASSRPAAEPIDLPPPAPALATVGPLAVREGTAVRDTSPNATAAAAEPGVPAGEAQAAPAEGEVAAPVRERPASAPPPAAGGRLRARAERPRPSSAPGAGGAVRTGAADGAGEGLALARVVPRVATALPDVEKAAGGRPLTDVPEVYRTRLDPNRTSRALEAGATPESEQAVERALDWLTRHQDADGRWNAATARYDDGTPLAGDTDFTAHCPANDRCFGACAYWEADTALTGLALLAYLGSGYTQADGKYASTVGKGLDFLRDSQKADGDLRGKSRAVGMYCHAMATLALCEAYALTADPKLRGPVQRAIAFLVGARARDGLSWRYAPGEPYGDTSILGWVVLAFKSAREVGLTVPATVARGTLLWLDKVAAGRNKGLGKYTPAEPVTPTMTAEAWVCRQFLGGGGPGPASSEAAAFLLDHGPKSDPYNLYYWYYGTLAMYQHGGDAWTRWNDEVRDEVVRRQATTGHAAGSWAPDDSAYGSKGGRVYCTALAALTLEVYYRYLRLYDDPKLPSPALPDAARRADGAVGRAARGR